MFENYQITVQAYEFLLCSMFDHADAGYFVPRLLTK